MLENVLRYVDKKIDNFCYEAVDTAIKKELQSDEGKQSFGANLNEKRDIYIYDTKVAGANLFGVVAVISVALATFSVISWFAAGLVAGGFSLASYAFNRAAGRHADGLYADQKELTQTARLKMLAEKAEVKLPEGWSSHLLEVKGFGLIRKIIPQDFIKKDSAENTEKVERENVSEE